jgi:hypothetical protein
MTAQEKWDELVERMDEVIASGEVLSRADARELVKRRYRHLADAEYPGGIGITSSQPRSRATAGTDSAERELDQRARELAARDRITYAVAYTRVLNADASLYLRYLQEHQAKLDAGARRG